MPVPAQSCWVVCGWAPLARLRNQTWRCAQPRGPPYHHHHTAGTRGTPWRLEAHKRTSAVSAAAFANFSSALLPPGSAAALSGGNGAVYAPTGAAAAAGTAVAAAEAPAAGGVRAQVVDYSREPMSGAVGVGGVGGDGVGRQSLCRAPC